MVIDSVIVLHKIYRCTTCHTDHIQHWVIDQAGRYWTPDTNGINVNAVLPKKIRFSHRLDKCTPPSDAVNAQRIHEGAMYTIIQKQAWKFVDPIGQEVNECEIGVYLVT